VTVGASGESKSSLAPSQPDLILIGLRGSGKTTLGRALAAQCGASFLDLDEALAKRAGTASAGEALRALGEPRFRALEETIAAELFDAARSDPPRGTVIALGGGTPAAAGTAELLARARHEGRARVVLLDASIHALAMRMAREKVDRPPLTSLPPKHEVALLASQRLDSYRALADTCINTTRLSIDRAIVALAQAWTSRALR